MRDERVREYIKPYKVLDSKNCINEEALIKNNYDQTILTAPNFTVVKPNGYITLDFELERMGGVRIIVPQNPIKLSKVRIRFGESLMEAMSEIEDGATNDHSLRDFITYLPQYSDNVYGESGYRFLRIDNYSDSDLYLLNVYQESIYRELNQVGSFECSDKLINKIFDTCVRTLHLNMQNYIWDGIKRDRLVWIGDMQPECLGILDLYDDLSILRKSVEYSEFSFPLPMWLNNMPTYDLWYLQIINDYFMKCGVDEWIKNRIPYYKGVINQLNSCIKENGEIDYNIDGVNTSLPFFIDWVSSLDEKDVLVTANKYLFKYVLNFTRKLYAYIGEDLSLIDSMINKLSKIKDAPLSRKQHIAFKVMSGDGDDKDLEKLVSAGAKGLSTFMSYFILSSIHKDLPVDALNILKEYYGGMLSLGATTFFEDFDIEWLAGACRLDEVPGDSKIDFHKTYGDFCYKGFRHSLSHGWSSGAIQYLFENVLGIKTIEPNSSVIEIKPSLGDLKFAKGSINTPYGKLSVECTNNNGILDVIIDAPKEIKII